MECFLNLSRDVISELAYSGRMRNSTRFTKAHCKYSLPSLRKNIPLAYDSVTLENIQNHFRKVRHYMFCYLEGLTPGKDLDQALLKYKTAKQQKQGLASMSNKIYDFTTYMKTCISLYITHLCSVYPFSQLHSIAKNL